jgi:hypothetical protein
VRRRWGGRGDDDDNDDGGGGGGDDDNDDDDDDDNDDDDDDDDDGHECYAVTLFLFLLALLMTAPPLAWLQVVETKDRLLQLTALLPSAEPTLHFERVRA